MLEICKFGNLEFLKIGIVEIWNFWKLEIFGKMVIVEIGKCGKLGIVETVAIKNFGNLKWGKSEILEIGNRENCGIVEIGNCKN